MAFGKWGFIATVSSLQICFLIIFSFAEKAPYSSFAKDATLAAPSESYDYIVIGGGTAGCPLAATLSASAKVLVLERGGLPYDYPNVTHITGLIPTLLDTSPSSPSQPFVSLDGVYNHRARILGGGSAINGGFYTRASEEYVREAGWEPQLVKESYEWVERKVVFKPQVKQWQAAVRDGLLEAGILPYRGFTYEHLQGTKIGGSIFDENGYRHTAADLLEYADPNMIRVYLRATVCQILFATSPGQKPKAYGVVFKDSKGTKHKALLNSTSTSEIIVSAGAVGSPQMLLVSGIGPSDELNAQGIDVIFEQPMVGQGMSDNPMNAILVPSPEPIEISPIGVVGIIDEIGCYIEAVGGFLDFLQELIPVTQSITQSGLILEKLARPFSTGSLELQSSDLNDNPLVRFNYFQDPRDLQMCIQGMQVIKRVVESQAFSAFRYPFTSFESLMEIMSALPNNLRKHVSLGPHTLEQFCVESVMTIWHYHGGCQMDKVVDHDYRVLGVDSLRVVDSSTFINSPGTNPQATVMMLGRYVGQKVLQELK